METATTSTPLAAAMPHRALLDRTWTYALEYDFIVGHLGRVPEGCAIVKPGADTDEEVAGLRLPALLSREVGMRHEWLPATAPELCQLPRDQLLPTSAVTIKASARIWLTASEAKCAVSA